MNDFETTKSGYVVVTDTIPNDGSADVSDAIQQLIDNNPNRTIYFPDGTYILGKPILTPAHPKKSVALKLSTFAVLKAAETWDSDEAMVRLGASHPANDIYTIGSNYSFTGGIVDGSGIAKGISIDGGRETMIRDVSIKHVRIGIHIKYGANSGSSDADIFGVNIIGNGAADSVGVLLEGYDNTLTNMRIARVFTGIELRSAGNSMRNLHPLYTCDYTDYGNSCGFLDYAGNNWYNFCYSDHFGIGFRTVSTERNRNVRNIYDSCFTMWYAARGDVHTAFRADGKFNSVLTNFNIGFHHQQEKNVVLSVGEPGGRGVFNRLSVNPKKCTDDTYKEYLEGGLF